MSKPLVSVVMAAYNCSEYIAESIESILQQCFTDFEFIIIDDGSTDDTSSIIQSFILDKRVKVLQQANKGVTDALNHGISHANGKYITRQDADDLSLPSRMQKQIEFLERNPDYGVIGSNVQLIDRYGGNLGYSSFPTEHCHILAVLRTRNCFVHGSVTFKKSLFDAVSGYCPDFLLAQDYDLWLRMSNLCKVANLSEVLYNYRQLESSLSGRFADLQKDFIQRARARFFALQGKQGGTQ